MVLLGDFLLYRKQKITRKAVNKMNTQQKYLITLIISHIACSLMVINEIHCNCKFQMYIYIFLPVAILIASGIAYKYVQSGLMYIVSFAALAICICMFWSNENIINKVFLHKPTYECIIYLVIILVAAISMPFISPNGILGIRIPQTMDYPEVWRKTHILTSLLLSLMILPTVIVMFYMESNYSFLLCNIFLLFPLIIGTVYAVVITIPIEKAEKEQTAKEFKEQIKKEQGYRYKL